MQLLGLHRATAEPKLRDTRVRELLAYEHDQWISHAGTAWAVMGSAPAGLDAAPVSASAR